MGISDYLAEVTKLTNTNLELLQALNDSLNSDANHLSVTVDGESYAIPSFISLENKLNTLQSNFTNLVNAPKTGETYFTFNGDSQAIYTRGFEMSPEVSKIYPFDGGELNVYTEDNNIFKDFLNPIPYIKFSLDPTPADDITCMDIRKVVAKSDNMKDEFKRLMYGEGDEDPNINNISCEWGELNKILYKYNEGIDYVMYDTIKKFPVRANLGYGNYVISNIIEEIRDENLNQYFVVEINSSFESNSEYQNTLTYKLFDDTIERQLQIGDILTNPIRSIKLEIVDIDFNRGVMKLWNKFNGYCNLAAYNGDDILSVPATATLCFYSNYSNYDDYKYVKVPLEEDKYIYVAVALVNDRMNIRASWGDGLLINTDNIYTENGEAFKEYYKNCTNIGDILNEISKVMSNTTTLLSNDTINDITTTKPIVEDFLYKVIKINDHLSDNATIQNIESLYKTKQYLKTQLEQVQLRINTQQNIILTTNFQDTTGVRSTAENELISLNKQKSEIVDSLNKNMQSIALAASNATIPIEKSKYRIRGFVDYDKFIADLNREGVTSDNIKGIQVQYQYVNPKNTSVGKALSFTSSDNKNFLFSDWNELKTFLRPRIRMADGSYAPEEDNSDANKPSFNQFDIPITQGEEVNVKIRIVYDFGYPFIQMTSDWSDVFTVEFPVDLVQDVDVVDIISENNDDIETDRFNKILNDNGVTAHVNDKINDQDKIYYHKPENISSGFYTEDSRRIIPLSDKLKEMSDNIAMVLAEVYNDVSKMLRVSVSYGDYSNIILQPNSINNLVFKDYKDFVNMKLKNFVNIAGTSYSKSINPVGGYTYYKYKQTDQTTAKYGYAETQCNITLTNISNKVVKIFPLFPAKSTDYIDSLSNVVFNKDDYSGIYLRINKNINPKGSSAGVDLKDNTIWTKQYANQIITFRNNDRYDNTPYYDNRNAPTVITQDNLLSSFAGTSTTITNTCPYVDIINEEDLYKSNPSSTDQVIYTGACVFPKIDNNSLFMTPSEAFSFKAINPGESIIIPLTVQYNLVSDSDFQVTKIMSFDIRTSLYEDPTNYTIKFITGYNMTDSSQRGYSDIDSGRSIYNPSVGEGW